MMTVRQFRLKAVPLIELTMGPHLAHEAKEDWAHVRGDIALEMVTRWAGPKLVGFCGLGPQAATDKVWLSWFAVHPDYQGCGIGTWLLAETEQLARSKGYRWMFVHTFTEARFLAARALYSRMGYTRIEDVEHEFSTDTVLLRKRLI